MPVIQLKKRLIPPHLLASIAAAIPSMTHADRRHFVNKFLRPSDEDIHRESPRCPRCKSRRTWQSGLAEGDERFRCREDGVWFVPEPEPEVVPEVGHSLLPELMTSDVPTPTVTEP